MVAAGRAGSDCRHHLNKGLKDMPKPKSAGRQRATFKLFGGRSQNPVGTATFLGKSYKKALAAGRRYLRNVAAGFYDADGVFHPIRASYDYKPSRAGEPPHQVGRKRKRPPGAKGRPRRRR
mgnify:CR=1 FL=1